MNTLLFDGVAFCLYLTSCFTLIKDITKNDYKKIALIFAWGALIAHIGSLSYETWLDQGVDFSFFHIASLISSIITFFLLIASLSKPVEKLGIALFPMAAFLLALDLAFPSNIQTAHNHSFAMNLHILSSIIAFSLLTIAAFQALLLILQNKQLKNHNPGRLMLAFPSLQIMESLLFQMISLGLFFLSTSLISGFVFIDDLFAQHLVHKTLLSILAWFVFSGLLLGRWCYGWRGKIAIRSTLYGFLLLLLAYFGSKLVLELILNKI